jgi:hypothetical protein
VIELRDARIPRSRWAVPRGAGHDMRRATRSRLHVGANALGPAFAYNGGASSVPAGGPTNVITIGSIIFVVTGITATEVIDVFLAPQSSR